jgi:hypothetical protein
MDARRKVGGRIHEGRGSVPVKSCDDRRDDLVERQVRQVVGHTPIRSR